VLRNTTVVSSVAILHTYEDRWILDAQRHHRDFDAVEHLLAYYRPLRELGINIDIVHPSANLESYKLVIAPNLHLLEPEMTKRFEQFVNNGGHLVLGPRSGVKTPDNAFYLTRPPGPLAALVGAEVKEYYALPETLLVTGLIGQSQARIWAEWLEVTDSKTEVSLRYQAPHHWLDGQAAATTRAHGTGRISLLGTWLDSSAMQQLAASWLEISQIQPVITAPPGVEICQRSSKTNNLYIIINHNKHAARIRVPEGFYDLLGNTKTQNEIELAPQGVIVLEETEVEI
jgi:beta-galactosidase